MQGRKKHILLILLLLLIAFVSMQMMAGQNYTEEKTRITVILPKDSQNELYGLLDGIRDQAYDDHVKLDVWYKSRLTEKALDELVKEEMENGSEGDPSWYIRKLYLEKKGGGYKKNNLLAVTDTMQSEFKYYAATLKSKKEQYRLPVEDAVLER